MLQAANVYKAEYILKSEKFITGGSLLFVIVGVLENLLTQLQKEFMTAFIYLHFY